MPSDQALARSYVITKLAHDEKVRCMHALLLGDCAALGLAGGGRGVGPHAFLLLAAHSTLSIDDKYNSIIFDICDSVTVVSSMRLDMSLSIAVS